MKHPSDSTRLSDLVSHSHQSSFCKELLPTHTLNLTFLYVTVSTLNPTVGMVLTDWPSFSLYRMVVLPAASRPNIRIRISLFPNTLDTILPMVRLAPFSLGTLLSLFPSGHDHMNAFGSELKEEEGEGGGGGGVARNAFFSSCHYRSTQPCWPNSLETLVILKQKIKVNNSKTLKIESTLQNLIAGVRALLSSLSDRLIFTTISAESNLSAQSSLFKQSSPSELLAYFQNMWKSTPPWFSFWGRSGGSSRGVNSSSGSTGQGWR